MSRIIYKYHLLDQTTNIPATQGARPLSVQVQNGVLTLWAIVDPDAPVAGFCAGRLWTGRPIPEAIMKSEYVGTVQLDNGLVEHVFWMEDNR